MTEEQKEILIAKMLDAPSSLSDEELDLISNDDELRDIYAVSASLSNANVCQPEIDIKAEWHNFMPRIQLKPSKKDWIMRVAAIFLGVIFATSIVVRIIDHTFSEEQQPAIAKIDSTPKANSTPVEHQNPQDHEEKGKAPEEEPKAIRSHTSEANNHIAKAEATKHTDSKAQAETDIDIDEYLRIQQARIDNDLAMQAAESYIEEYDDLVAMLDAAGAYNPALDNMIRTVTME